MNRGTVVAGLLATSVVVLLLAILAGMLSPQTPAPPQVPGEAGNMTPEVRDPDVDLGSPDAACETFASVLFTAAAADASGPSAYRRAAAYTTGDLAAVMSADMGRSPWQGQRPSDGFAVDVSPYAGDHIQPGTGDVAYRAVVVSMTGPLEHIHSRHIVYCTLHLTGEVWLVADYELERTPR